MSQSLNLVRPERDEPAAFRWEHSVYAAHPAPLRFSPGFERWLARLLASLCIGSCLTLATTEAATGAAQTTRGTSAPFSIALHYGNDPPLAALRAFDIVVVDPDHLVPAGRSIDAADAGSLYAYVSIGEAGPGRAWGEHLPAAMVAGRNEVWNSRIIDQAHPDWPAFFVDRVVAPLWARGFRGFFLDTMDSWHAIATDDSARARQQAGLVATLRLLKARFPDAQLIANRGFEVLPQIHGLLRAVAAESLYGRWNAHTQTFEPVPEADRRWLLDRFDEVRALGLPTIAIDYAPPGDRERTRELARRIAAHGVVPYVTDGTLTSIGIGAVEVMPRRVLLVHNGARDADGDEHYSPAQWLVAMPLHYLGWRVELLDIQRKDLPSGPLADRYAAVVGVFETQVDERAQDLARLIRQAVAEKVPLVFLNDFGLPSDSRVVRDLGLALPGRPLRPPVAVAYAQAPVVGFEAQPLPDPSGVAVSAPSGSTPLLTIRDARGQTFDGVALTPWGGYAVRPFTTLSLNRSAGAQWVIDPIEFLRRAIDRHGARPIPDVTTEAGRRLLMVHIDGDGFASRAEIPGSPLAAEVMLKDFIARYRVPHTVSVIEGEVGPEGLYPELSPTLERIAREIFALDHVEIASHSYSHPFFWRTVVAAEKAGRRVVGAGGRKMHLPLLGYDFRLERDIRGSASYIDHRLAPPGKRTRVFLWTGDCVPPAAAIRATHEAGLLNMNGGDTTITRRFPSLTRVAPMSLRKDGWLQVFAPNQNENVYTNDWTGPFYGFDAVIETFELTDRPRRLKPMNIYYHTYSASKHSAIAALHRVYQWALAQPHMPVYGSEYILKVHDFEDFSIAREIAPPAGTEVFRLVGDGALRTVRLPAPLAQRVDWHRSDGVAGRREGVDGDYLHLAAARTRLVLAAEAQPLSTEVAEANGRIDDFERDGDSIRFRFRSHVAGELAIAHRGPCRVRAGAHRLQAANPQLADWRSARLAGDPQAPDDPSTGLSFHHYRIGASDARAGVLVQVDC